LINLNSKTYSGFTLVEVLVSIILASLAFTIFLQALNTGKSVRQKSELRTKQSVILNSVENQIRARKFDENSSVPWSNTLGKDAGESSISQFDDIDDFHLYSESSISNFPGFGFNVSVYYTSTVSKFRSSISSQSNYKSVVVTISHATISSLIDTLIIIPEW
jgi:prepilin-type N-terminal cleavage/methylation domain-containing protein